MAAPNPNAGPRPADVDSNPSTLSITQGGDARYDALRSINAAISAETPHQRLAKARIAALSTQGAATALKKQDLPSLERLREAALLAALATDESTHSATSVVAVYETTALLAVHLDEYAVAKQWRTEQADFVSALRPETQTQLHPAQLADNALYEASILSVRQGDVTTAHRLLDRIDTLATKRQPSPFYAAAVADAISQERSVAEAYEFAAHRLAKVPAHADLEAQATFLISRVAAYASQLPTDVADRRAEAQRRISTLEDILNNRSDALAQANLKAERMRSSLVGRSRDLHKWEREVVTSEIKSSLVRLTRDVDREQSKKLAIEFIERYPMHPGLKGIAGFAR